MKRLLLLLSLLAVAAGTADTKPLNIVVLYADDWRLDAFEENDVAKDPAHAKQLAEMRARFAELKATAK